ncbi:hypothetical protein MTR67_006049 [Solanum verrucosum]|uniref:Uncharacterized protein n=1 Tax=Solanum verrucosum TaxID=315347 RepID=A0AAF0Q3A3_SOLVR|nr:hypothetical protein MTR67_006049 [Solanum verrucosum]
MMEFGIHVHVHFLCWEEYRRHTIPPGDSNIHGIVKVENDPNQLVLGGDGKEAMFHTTTDLGHNPDEKHTPCLYKSLPQTYQAAALGSIVMKRRERIKSCQDQHTLLKRKSDFTGNANRIAITKSPMLHPFMASNIASKLSFSCLSPAAFN